MSESLRVKLSKSPLATILMWLSAPGILAQLGYYLVDHELLAASLRPAVKSFVDQNFLLWAVIVLPSFLVFGVCVIVKFLEWANPSHWGSRAKQVRLALTVAWAGAVLWSVLSLALFRSSAGHGPDMVGEEVSRFLLPLAVATVLSLGVANAHHPRSSFPGFSLLATTAAITLIEVAVYCLAIVR